MPLIEAITLPTVFTLILQYSAEAFCKQIKIKSDSMACTRVKSYGTEAHLHLQSKSIERDKDLYRFKESDKCLICGPFLSTRFTFLYIHHLARAIQRLRRCRISSMLRREARLVLPRPSRNHLSVLRTSWQ